MSHPSRHLPRNIYSVSALTDNIKQILEESFPILWITGEISNLRIPSSGHAYFSLKDQKAQIAAVMFKGQLRQTGFHLEDGTTIVGMGRIAVYEPRGTYQVILEYVEPHGLGALQLAFEQLKRKLDNEGLFDARHKRPLPLLPQKIGVITSPSGAALRDILNVCQRRFPNLSIEVFPVRVQGDMAPAQILRAIQNANQLRKDLDLLILARGGGSIEDLAAFNDEGVARAIFDSHIPVISAIGHETDFTIADFVADMRAPTPSAAAEIAVPVKAQLSARCHELRKRCVQAMQRRLEQFGQRYETLRAAMLRPYKAIQEHLLAVDDYEQRMLAAMDRRLAAFKVRHENMARYLFLLNLKDYIVKHKSKLELLDYQLHQNLNLFIDTRKQSLHQVHAALNALSPMAVLQRGYSITRTIEDKTVVVDAQETLIGQPLEVLLAKGALKVKVEKRR